MRYYYLFIILLLLGPASLSAQKKIGKTNTNKIKWQNIPRLVVPPGQTFQLESNFVQIETLIMHPSSGLSLPQGDNVIIVGHANIGPRARITGRGKNGVNGQNGRSGEPAARLPGVRDGSKGTDGRNGGNAPNLKLYLGTINNGANLNVNLTGGNGGNGGNGGDGGTHTIRCGDIKKVKGTNGGDGGESGGGGRAGVLTLVLGNEIERKSITYQSIAGRTGSPGHGGRPGWVIIKCWRNTTRSQPGSQGNGKTHSPYPVTPDTNPDFLEFPSPVPDPSALKDVPINIPTGSTYGTVNMKLKSALNACGYDDLNYRRHKDGFAVFTKIEHITNKGIPLTEPDRFSPEKVIFYDDPSLIAFLKSFISARKGYFRIIVFIVTDDGISTKAGGVARSEAITWLTAGIDELPEDIGRRPYTDKHKLKALIYEFSKRENGSEPVFSEPRSIIDIDQHLQSTRLWSMLITE